MFPSSCNTLSYSSTSSLSSISSFRCAFTSSSYHFLHPTRSPLPRPTHHSLPHRPQYSVSQWVSVSRLRVFNMVSCTKGAKYALCALHDNGAGIRCRLQVAGCKLQLQHAGNISIIVARRCSWTASKLPPPGAVSALKPTKSFQSRHSKLSPRLIALLRTAAAATNRGGTERKECVVGCTVAPCQPGTGNQNHSQLPRSFLPLGSCV